ncbi:MAG: hypothetical protein J6K45_05830 [Clostridia bacterium]|nr:hypothetical protein [Clostridia bacterium]
MSIELDFVKQLTTTKAVKEEADVINKKHIKESYNSLIDSAFLFGKSRPEFEKLQDKIRLKFSYICLIKILEDVSEDYEVEKQDLRDKARQIFQSAENYKEVLREKNKSKCRYINPYQNLLLGNSATKVEIIRGYERQLSVISKMLDLQLTKVEIDPREIIETYSTFLLQNQSFEILANPISKREIDEEILINFNPNQSSLYSKVGIGELSYIPEKEGNIYKMINRFNDIIMFQKIGTLGYEKFKQKGGRNTYRDDYTLQHYRVKKEYRSLIDLEYDKDIPEKEFTIFTDLNIAELTSDPDFTALHADILFSDLNLTEAEKYNGGYTGEIIQNDNGKFDVYHYQDKLCACIEYEKHAK